MEQAVPSLFSALTRWDVLPGGRVDELTPVDLDAEIVRRVLSGETDQFETLIKRHQARIFATARRYARREDEVEDIVQEVFVKAFQKLGSFRAEAPFEHWLMKLAIRTCYDALRSHQRNREHNFTEVNPEGDDWLERLPSRPEAGSEQDSRDAAHALIWRALEELSPAARLVLTLLEVEDKSVKEIAQLTGWSVPLVKVRAFRARAELRKVLERMAVNKYL